MKVLILFILFHSTIPFDYQKPAITAVTRQIRKELGVKVIPSFLIKRKDTCDFPGPFRSSLYEQRFSCYQRRFSFKRRVLVLGEATDGVYQYGMARAVCSKSLAYVSAEVLFPATYRTAILHEIGHLLGANHREGENVMSSSALNYDKLLHFSPQSKVEVTQCLKRLR